MKITELSYSFDLCLTGAGKAVGELQLGTNLIAEVLYVQRFHFYEIIQPDKQLMHHITLPHWIASELRLELHVLSLDSNLEWGVGNKVSGIVYGVLKEKEEVK